MWNLLDKSNPIVLAILLTFTAGYGIYLGVDTMTIHTFTEVK